MRRRCWKKSHSHNLGSASAAELAGGGQACGILTILGISLLAVWLFAYPISNLFQLSNPIAVGVMAGLFVFIGLYSASTRRK